MSQPPAKTQWIVWGGLCVIIAFIVTAFVRTQVKRPSLPIYGGLPAFTLTNQDGQPETLDDLRGNVWIADAIFTRCPGQCLVMSAHMKQLQAALPADEPIRLVSLTTDAVFDRPPVLKKYGERFGAQNGRWLFLTGDKAALRRVEVDGMKLSVVDKPAAQQESAADLFIHSEKFVLIDKAGQIRGYYDGQESSVVPRIAADARSLAGE